MTVRVCILVYSMLFLVSWGALAGKKEGGTSDCALLLERWEGFHNGEKTEVLIALEHAAEEYDQFFTPNIESDKVSEEIQAFLKKTKAIYITNSDTLATLKPPGLSKWVQEAKSVFEDNAYTEEIEQSDPFGYVKAFDYTILLLTDKAGKRIFGAGFTAVAQGYELEVTTKDKEGREVKKEVDYSYPTHAAAEKAGADLSQDISWTANAYLDHKNEFLPNKYSPYEDTPHFEWTGLVTTRRIIRRYQG